MSSKQVFLILLIVLSLFTINSLSAKILILFPLPSKSHNILGKALADILHESKHEITFISGLPHNDTKYRVLDITSDWFNVGNLRKPFDEQAKTSILGMLVAMPVIINIMMEATFTTPNIRNLFDDKSEKFDLVISEYFFNHELAGLGVKYDCPVIMVSPVVLTHWIARYTGNPVSPATIPNVLLPFNADMDFTQRVINTAMTVFQEAVGFLIADWYQRASYKKNLPEEAALVPYSELSNKIALVFSNSHPSIGSPRPLLPNTIEIGGYHISDKKKIPEEYRKLIESSKNGVIYFSMGSTLKSAEIPNDLKNVILRVFANRKETVLWKYEEENLSNVPKNVVIKSWVPQASVLKHPNVKLFISHGGYLSTTEAASAGIPVLSIPIFGDQFMNAQTTKDRGCGLFIDYSNLTETSLTWALNEILGNQKYNEAAKKISKLFNDRPMDPRELVVFYTEHVIRTGGAKHLSAPRLPLYSLLLLDVICVLVLPPLLLIFIITSMCKKFGGNSKPKTKADERKKNK